MICNDHGIEKCYVCGAPTELERRLIDVDGAARIWRVSRTTIYRWMRKRLIEWIELPSGAKRIYLDSLFKDPPCPLDMMT